MVKPEISSFNSLTPLSIQKYERYLPTAFDDSLNMLEKVNKMIIYLNQIGQLTNDVVEQWNAVMEWLLADGLDAEVSKKLEEMELDGSLSAIINEEIFNDLNTQLDNLENKQVIDVATLDGKITSLDTELASEVSNLDSSIVEVESKVDYIGKNMKSLGAKGDYISDAQRGTNDTAIFQNALNQGGVIFIPKGKYYINDNLFVKSNTRLIFDPSAVIHSYAEKTFSFLAGIENVRFEQCKIVNHFSGTSYAFYLKGDYSQQYATTVKNIVVEQSMAEGHTWSFYMENVRKMTIRDFHGYTKNGVYYIGKSAENVIADSNFVNFDEVAMTNSKGLYCVADVGGGYPEGLMIRSTLFYHYERNIHIRDMYIGKFDNLYLDGNVSACKENLIEYNARTEFLTFDNTWTLGRGFILGGDGYTSPKELRTKFTNTVMDFLTTDGFVLKDWVRSVELINTSYYGDGSFTKTAIVGFNWNNFLKIHGLVSRFAKEYVHLKGNGENIYIDDITNYDNYANNGIYHEMPVKLNGVTV